MSPNNKVRLRRASARAELVAARSLSSDSALGSVGGGRGKVCPCHRASSKPASPVKLERLKRPASSRSVESMEVAPHVKSTSSRELSSRSRELLRLTNSSTVSESRSHVGDMPGVVVAGCCIAAPPPPDAAAKGEAP
eukprot:scaffold56150_cov49-Phaeocystis_antarctica.AAC.3